MAKDAGNNEKRLDKFTHYVVVFEVEQKNHIILIRPIPVEDVIRGQQLVLPLGMLYLTHALLENGYDVTMVDIDNDIALEQIDKALNSRTLFMGISTMSGTQLKNACVIAKELKRKYKNMPLVWGGVHVTNLPEQSLKSDLVDYIVWGEGEVTIVKLADALRDKKYDEIVGMPGVGLRKGDEIIIGKNSGYTPLDRTFELPYHLLEMDRYCRDLIIGAQREYLIWTSRGCPFDCTFCGNTSELWSNSRVRYHTHEHVVKDVKTLATKYGADMINLADQCFLLNEKRFVDMLHAIRNAGVSVKYKFSTRIDLLARLKEETWEAMKEFGVVAISCAPESGSQKVLDYMKKGITLEQVYKVDELLSKHNIYKAYNILFRTPYETIDDMKATLTLICNLAKTSLSSPYPFGNKGVNKYLPLPGTEMYYDAIKCGFKQPETLEDWQIFDKDMDSTWNSDEYRDLFLKADELIMQLNYQLVGAGTNVGLVKEIISKIEQLAK